MSEAILFFSFESRALSLARSIYVYMKYCLHGIRCPGPNFSFSKNLSILVRDENNWFPHYIMSMNLIITVHLTKIFCSKFNWFFGCDWSFGTLHMCTCSCAIAFQSYIYIASTSLNNLLDETKSSLCSLLNEIQLKTKLFLIKMGIEFKGMFEIGEREKQWMNDRKNLLFFFHVRRAFNRLNNF